MGLRGAGARQGKPKDEFLPHSGTVLAGLSGSARFDSLKVMASGNITIATLNTGYITEISPAGDIVRAVKMPDRYPTNFCSAALTCARPTSLCRTAVSSVSCSGRSQASSSTSTEQ
jgi:hypothetical protein